MINLIITNLIGAQSIDLQNESIHQGEYANFSLNRENKRMIQRQKCIYKQDDQLLLNQDLE